MAGRKCVYTVILLSVCAVWPRPNFSFGMLSSCFCKHFFFFFPPPPTSFFLSFSASPHPTYFPSSDTHSSTVTEEADRIAIAITWLVTLVSACSSHSSISLGASILRLAYWLVLAQDNMLWFLLCCNDEVYWQHNKRWSLVHMLVYTSVPWPCIQARFGMA